MIVASVVEAVIVFFLTPEEMGVKMSPGSTYKNCYYLSPFKRNSDTNNLISLFSRISPKLFL